MCHFLSIKDQKTEKLSFNLSSFQIPDAQCTVLGKLLAHDALIHNIQLNDCNLSSEGRQHVKCYYFVV
jgi:hypothetical protein